MTVLKHVGMDVWTVSRKHSVHIDKGAYHCQYDTASCQSTVKPVVIFAVNAYKYNGEKHYSPKESTCPVYAIQRHLAGHPEGTCKKKYA